MITEQDKEKQEIDRLKNGIHLCEEAMSKAEKYERLSENKDWKDYQDDLKIVIKKHEQEILMAASSLPDAPSLSYVNKDGKLVSSKADWADFIQRHEIQRVELMRWLSEPQYMVDMAKMAREKLPVLKDQLSKMETVDASRGNGKS